MVTSQTLLPSAPLREYVRQFLRIEASLPGGNAVRPIIARTELVLAFNLSPHAHRAFEYHAGATRTMPDLLLVGPQTSRRADLLLGDRWSTFAIHFQPSAFVRLFGGTPVAAFTDRAVDARDVLGPAVGELHERLQRCTSTTAMARAAERFLEPRLPASLPLHPTGRAAAAMLESHGRLKVADAIRLSGLSERHFERRFAEHMGLAPKLFARVARLNYVVRLKAEQPALTWVQISQDAGYFDQTHLVKDFKAMAGAPPGAFLRGTAPADGGFLLSSLPQSA
jgi:AraC-like DNA-binding protein